MIIHRMPQRSDEWYAVRLGKITGTQFQTMANGRKDTIDTLCYKIAAERLTGQPCEKAYTNSAMENGVALEPLARAAYETTAFAAVDEVGFLELDEFVGCSPDGLVGDDGGVEIKCPEAHTHLKNLGDSSCWKAYKWQLQGALWVTDRKWWDFVSFCPLFPPGQQLVVCRVKPDAKAFSALDAGSEYCRNAIVGILDGVSHG